MSIVQDYIIRDYVIADPYQGAASFKEALLNDNPVIVMENKSFIGILTLNDLIERPHILVVDSMLPKPVIESKSDIFPVLLSMCQNNFDFLPVSSSGVFEGVICKKSLLHEFLNNMNDMLSGKGDFRDLKNELIFKDRLLAIIGHDLKNMFNQVLGSLELLDIKLQNLEEPKVQAVLRLARRSTEQIYSTFEGILNWARMDTGSFNPELISLNVQLDKAVDQFQLAGNLKSVAIRNLLIQDLVIYADRHMLFSILLNLIYNAIKFTPNGGEITLDAIAVDNNIEIVVADSGVGLSLQQQEQLFKSNNSQCGTQNELGTGIGLAICKDLVEKHKGNIHIESKVGQGTRVIISMPNHKHLCQFENF